MKSFASKNWMAIVILAIFLVIIAVGSYIGGAWPSSNQKQPTQAVTASAQPTPPPEPEGNQIGKEYSAFNDIINVSILSIQKDWHDPKLEAAYRVQQSTNAVADATPPPVFTLIKVRYRNTSDKLADFTNASLADSVLSLPGLTCGQPIWNQQEGHYNFLGDSKFSNTSNGIKPTYPARDSIMYDPGTVNKNFAAGQIKEGFVQLRGSCQYIGGTDDESWWKL